MLHFFEKLGFAKAKSGVLKYFDTDEKKDKAKIVLYKFLISFLCYYMLEISCKNYTFIGFLFTFVNIFMIYALISVLALFTVKTCIAAIDVSVICTVLALINFYTVLFRNQPVSPLDIYNAGTALDVIGSYKFGFHITVIIIVLLLLLCIYASMKIKKLEKGRKYTVVKYLKRIALTLCLSFLLFYSVFFAENSLKPKLTLVWSWEESYHNYGYLASSMEMLVKSFNALREPENYDENALKEYAEKAAEENDADKKVKTPDIIFILNETFYDLNLVTELNEDKEAMPYINNLDNKIYGYCFVPGVGGGTNRSEYEFLTSNSLNLMPDITPFSFLDLNGANSIVSFLKELGYSTWAAHCAPSLNYSRGTAYPKLGFEKTMFDEDFDEREYYGNRNYVTDEYMYDVLIDEYNKMGDAPRFMYTLTIQNHGGWDLNPEEEDTVHAKADFGKYDSEVDEYLSCIALSDAAFGSLTEYFENVDRDVIICMVGDHAPSWIKDVADETDSDFEKQLVSAAPFVIWANFDIEDENAGYTSLPYLAPLVLKNAGVPLSPFYSFMLKMYEKYPVISANNYYVDNNNNIYAYADENCPEEINMYLNMVYNSVGKKAAKIDALFKVK